MRSSAREFPRMNAPSKIFPTMYGNASPSAALSSSITVAMATAPECGRSRGRSWRICPPFSFCQKVGLGAAGTGTAGDGDGSADGSIRRCAGVGDKSLSAETGREPNIPEARGRHQPLTR